MKTIHLLSLTFFFIAFLCLCAPAQSDFPTNPMTGYASIAGEGMATTTGGAGGDTIYISTLEELQDWAANREKNTTPEIVVIAHKITSPESTIVTIKHGANISILGRGEKGELENVGLNIRNYDNVIIRNLEIHEVLYPNDALTLDDVLHGWVDHCVFYSKREADTNVDTYDGLLDIKKGSRYLTVSWCSFADHFKTILIGHTDNQKQQATDSLMRITFHHNFFRNTNGRNPSLRFGAVHMYNNYFMDIDDYGIALRQGSHGLLENNIYDNVKLPISTNKFDGESGDGYVCETGNIFTGGSGNNSISQTDCDFWKDLPYTYTLDLTEGLKDKLLMSVGNQHFVMPIDTVSTDTIDADTTDAITLTVMGFASNPHIFPNPASDMLHVTGLRAQRLFILDLMGTKVLEQYIADRSEVSISTHMIPAGVYILITDQHKATAGQSLIILH